MASVSVPVNVNVPVPAFQLPVIVPVSVNAKTSWPLTKLPLIWTVADSTFVSSKSAIVSVLVICVGPSFSV